MIENSNRATLPNWYCQDCGKYIGYIGNFFAWLFGNRFHKCNFNRWKKIMTEKEFPDAPLDGNWLDQKAYLMGEPITMGNTFPLYWKIYFAIMIASAVTGFSLFVYLGITGQLH